MSHTVSFNIDDDDEVHIRLAKAVNQIRDLPRSNNVAGILQPHQIANVELKETREGEETLLATVKCRLDNYYFFCFSAAKQSGGL